MKLDRFPGIHRGRVITQLPIYPFTNYCTRCAFLIVVLLLAGCKAQPPPPPNTETPEPTSSPSPAPLPTPTNTPVVEPPILPVDLPDMTITPTINLGSQVLFGYTYQQAEGNRLVAGRGVMHGTTPTDIDLDGVPAWVVGAPIDGNGSIWVVVLDDGRVQGFMIIERS